MTRSSELRSQITEAETRIADLVRQLAELRTHKTQLEAELRAIVYPILSIPAEITAEILYHAASHSETEWLLAATGVCRLWRNIALSTPRLWTEFYSDPWCRILTHLKDRGPLLQLWLSRSGSLPLNLAVHVGLDGERILASLAKHISRWRRVNLHEGSQCCHGALDRGQPRPSLALHGDVPLPDVDATCCPKWRSLVFCESSVVPGALLPMLANVTHLTLDRVDPAVVSKILLYATAVENLSVQSSRLEFPIVLPLVHTLHYHDGAPGLLDHSNLPALANLHIICRHSYPAAEAVKGFLTRSGCTLQLVHVENCRLNGLLDFLRALPSLPNFTGSLQGSGSLMSDDEVEAVLDALSAGELFPDIEKLTLLSIPRSKLREVHSAVRKKIRLPASKLNKLTLELYRGDVVSQSLRRALDERGVKLEILFHEEAW